MSPFSSIEWLIATRYLRSRRSEGFISVIAWFSLIGIALGVATLIIVMSVMNGFREELLGRVLGLNGHIVAHGINRKMLDFDEISERIRSLNGVLMATPIIESQVMVTAGKNASGALVRGIRAGDMQDRTIVMDNIVDGNLDDFLRDDSVIIGVRLARRLNVGVGEQITILSPQTTVTAFGSVPRLKSYRIAVIFEVGMYEYDSNFIYMPLKAAQIYFRLGKAVNGIEVHIADPDDVFAYREPINSLEGVNRVSDWQQINRQFFLALKTERNVMFLILTLIILVACFNIISSLIMLVNDKTKAIAILRTMGATRGMVMRIFTIIGTSVGILGTLIGFILGLTFCLNIETIRGFLESLTGTELWSAEVRFLSQIPAEINNTEVILVVVMAILLSFCATIYPAWRAAVIDPVEALRYE